MDAQDGAWGARPGSYRDLVVWQMAMDLASFVYAVTEDFPAREHYGLAQQIRRSAISIPSNLAEGHGRTGGRDRLRFMEIAKGSLFELETQMELAARLGYVSEGVIDETREHLKAVGRPLNGLIRHLRR